MASVSARLAEPDLRFVPAHGAEPVAASDDAEGLEERSAAERAVNFRDGPGLQGAARPLEHIEEGSFDLVLGDGAEVHDVGRRVALPAPREPRRGEPVGVNQGVEVRVEQVTLARVGELQAVEAPGAALLEVLQSAHPPEVGGEVAADASEMTATA